MARINIEITDTGATGEPGGATRVQMTAAPHPSADASAVPAELAAKAAIVGAQNAGPAPSIGGTQASSAPVPFLASNVSGSAPAESVSAGAAPAHLFGS